MEFNKGLSSLIEVLKNISVSQYRTLEKKLKSFEELMLTVEDCFEFVDFNAATHPFLNPRNKPQAVLAITTDSGLLGGLNMQVVNAALFELDKDPGQLVVIGERGKMYARESKIPFVAFPGIKDEERVAQAMQMRDFLCRKVLEGSFGMLKVVYPRPISFTVQRVETAVFFPFTPPKPGNQDISGLKDKDIILESKLDDIVEYLVYLWVGQKLYEIFGLSRLAEFSARYVHLEESLQKLKNNDIQLRQQYFRIRHELIDRNMRELFSARLLYS